MSRSELHPSYINTWRGVLDEVLDWPSEQVEEFIGFYQNAYKKAGYEETSIYHNVAADYVKKYAIPISLREKLIQLASFGVKTLLDLENEVETMIENLTDENGIADWDAVREELGLILARFGVSVPGREDAQRFWTLGAQGVVH